MNDCLLELAQARLFGAMLCIRTVCRVAELCLTVQYNIQAFFKNFVRIAQSC